MKKKIINRKRIYKRRRVTTLTIIASTILLTGLAVKGNQPKIVGYTYDTGSTVWEMAKKHCPDGVDIRSVVDEIERVNGMKNAVVYDYMSYKIPIYENSTREIDYLDMSTIIGYNPFYGYYRPDDIEVKRKSDIVDYVEYLKAKGFIEED